MKFTIRPATHFDVPSILAIVNDAIEKTTANYDYEPHSIESHQKWFDEKIGSGFPVIVAEAGGTVAGFGTYGPFRFKYGYRFTVEHSVYVKDEFIGRGIGSLLLSELIRLAKNQGLHLMIGGIDGSNEQSIRFHEKFGFEKCGFIPEAAFKFDRWLDLQLMMLRL